MVFVRDLETPAGGEDSALMRIVQSSFSKREWENARVDLLHFLSLPHSEDTEGRARFYLGQALYFTGSCREALIEFLSVQSRHPAEAKDWIEAALTEMTR
jgi:TolA-binding protein